ncbi:hypothetical protein EV189_0738 [Motilibacter rhizosphaerae]|uniref:Uncharacterized protein n=1 Tax=Motilibacter rhizosphaerae TaxID=598652 RepID=A0A4Q7NW33_9ACTN|nr:hypothetical protein [Motilibacter rhizosphaerae]RZS91496.1 hypothetical protein EV189_0738 [Motilibacter rhizosphaerae]
MSPRRAGLLLAGGAAVLLAAGLVAHLQAPYAVALALVPPALLAALLLQRSAGARTAPLPPPEVQERLGGRRELDRFAWSLSGVHGRVSEEALRLLRPVARERLRRAGVDVSFEDAAPGPAADAARALLGERAWATLTSPGGVLPRPSDVEHTIEVLEELCPSPATDRSPA